jgi:hypothetical protein
MKHGHIPQCKVNIFQIEKKAAEKLAQLIPQNGQLITEFYPK